jgi:hypothetical protein
MELMQPLEAMLIGDEGGVISSDRLEPGTVIEMGDLVGVSPATGQEMADFYLTRDTGSRYHYRAPAAELRAAIGTATT